MSETSVRKIAKARVALMFDAPFFGHLALNFQLVENNKMKIPTMATDGTHLFYDDTFVKNISLDQLKFVIAHEVGHIVLWHIPRLVGRDPELWNVACDFVDNGLLKPDFPDMPTGVLLDNKYDNKTADWVYVNIPPEEGGKPTLDSHDMWKDWGKEKEKDDGSNPIEQDWRERIASAAMEARQKGKLSGGLKELVGEVLQPKLSWKEILRDTVTSVSKNDFRWNPPNKKHLHRGFILPGISGEEIKIAVAIDTSGSIDSKLLAQFLGEIEGICTAYENYTLHLYAADSEIKKYWELHEMEPIPRDMPGRGGTSFAPVIDDLKTGKKEFSLLVYLTDLCGDQESIKDPGFPVIWVSTDREKVPFGTVILLPKER